MARLLLAWTILVLLLLGASLIAHDPAAVAGQLSATEQEAEEGYFALGPDATIVARPGSELHRWLRNHTGQQIKLSLEPHLESDADPQQDAIGDRGRNR